MERMIVNPSEVRGLGDIVSPKSVSDFVGYNAKVVSGTDSSLGTVYTDSYLTGSSITLTHPRSISKDDTSFTVTALLKDSDGYAISGASLSLDVNGTVYTGTTTTTGVSFTVVTDGSDVYCMRCVWTGATNKAGSSCIGTVYVPTGVDSVELFVEKDIIQTGDTDVFVSRVKNNDKPVQGATVDFCRQVTNGTLFKDSTEHTLSSGTILDIGCGLLSDLDNFELSFDLKATGNSRFCIGSQSYFNTNNPQMSVFISIDANLKLGYGYRDTSTNGTASSVTVTSGTYYSCKIVRDGDTFSFYQGATLLGTKSVTWFDDFDDYMLGLVAFSSSVSVRNIVLKVGD